MKKYLFICLVLLCGCTKTKYITKEVPIEIIKEVEVPVYIEQTDPAYYVKFSTPIAHISPEGWMEFYNSSGTPVGVLDWSSNVFTLDGNVDESAVEFLNILNAIVEFTND